MKLFLQNLMTLLLIVIGIVLFLILTGQGGVLKVFGDVVGVYSALGLLPFVLIMLVLGLLPRRRRGRRRRD